MRTALQHALRFTLLAASLALLMLAPVVTLAQPPGPQQAGLIVVGEEGAVTTYCVTFTESALTGLSLLERAGVELRMRSGGGGTAICGIGDVGCPATDCFCQCKAAPCRYWSYFHRDTDGAWRYSARGADSWPIANGDVDAWVWGDGSVVPPSLSVAEICTAAVTPTPVLDTPLSSEPPLSAQTATPLSATQVPVATETAGTPTALAGYGFFVLFFLVLLGTLLTRRARRS